MRYTFEEEFRFDHPETVGETDSHFDLENYKDWLEAQLIEARKQLALYNAVCSCYLCGKSIEYPEEQYDMYGEVVCQDCWDYNMSQALQDGGGM
jgi:hypothetical protein